MSSRATSPSREGPPERGGRGGTTPPGQTRRPTWPDSADSGRGSTAPAGASSGSTRSSPCWDRRVAESRPELGAPLLARPLADHRVVLIKDTEVPATSHLFGARLLPRQRSCGKTRRLPLFESDLVPSSLLARTQHATVSTRLRFDDHLTAVDAVLTNARLPIVFHATPVVTRNSKVPILLRAPS